MSTRLKKLLVAWVCVGLGLSFAHHEGWLKPVIQKGALAMLQHKLKEANKAFPQPAGEGVVAEPLEAGEEGGKIFVRQTLTLTQLPFDRVDPQQIRDMIRPSALESYCAGDMSKPNSFFEMVFHVAVFSSDRQPITDIALEPADCPR